METRWFGEITEFGREQEVSVDAIKGFAEHCLRGALAIHGRGVEIGDAQVQRLAHGGYAIGEGTLGEKGATQPEGGGLGACSSVVSYFHYRIPGLFICWVLDAVYRYNGHCFDFDQPVGVD